MTPLGEYYRVKFYM